MQANSQKYAQIQVGDKIKVERKVIEGGKERAQIIEGIVIARRHGQEPGGTLTVRKISSGIGVEFVFPVFSPLVKSIKVIKKSKVRRAKLYYLRDRSGRATRLKESQAEIIVEEDQPVAKETPKKAPKKEEKKEEQVK